MRTALSIDDVLATAKGMAAVQNKTVGEVLSSLARQALQSKAPSGNMRSVPLLTPRPGAPPVTPELVNQLRDELP